MAKHAVDKAAIEGKLTKKACVTAALHIHGYMDSFNKDSMLLAYGSDSSYIMQLMGKNPALKENIHPVLPYSKAMVVWAVQQEMAMTVEDVLARRTRALFLDAKAAMEAAPAVAVIMATIMNKDEAWQQQQVSEFIAIADNYLVH